MSREIEFRAFLIKQLKVVDIKRIDFEAQEIVYEEIDFEYEDVIREKTALFKDIFWLQYTGLKDKNGVKIFEGDIVKFYNDVYGTTETFKVVWSNDYCEIILSSVKYGKRYLEKSRENFIEVIGNVFENKELLENE